jgi:hypothetical protein
MYMYRYLQYALKIVLFEMDFQRSVYTMQLVFYLIAGELPDARMNYLLIIL